MSVKLRCIVIFFFINGMFSLSSEAYSTENQNNSDKREKVIPAFTAKYALLHKSDQVGDGIRTLSYDDKGLAQYSYNTKIKWLIFSDERQEKTTVRIDKNRIIPISYDYQRTGTGKDKSYKWQYDTVNNTATNIISKNTIAVDFSQNIQTPLSYHLQQRLDLINTPKQELFNFSILKSKGSIKDYTYQYDGEEELLLPYGAVKAIRLKRESSNKTRITYAWFAPELDYLLVKLYQTKSGAEQYEALLTELTIQ
ncbi:DUF3108 domain-containing protein [Colwelliaceae bacterium 6441]